MSTLRKVTGDFPHPVLKRSTVIKKIQDDLLTPEEQF